ncbi:MAG: minor capsid protein [Oscillospiraceae bacterium]
MSDNNIKVTLKIAPTNVLLARRNLQPGGKVQKYIDSEVLRCSDAYVPFLTGRLKQSGITSTVVGSGMVHYNTPYARKNYYQNAGNGIQGTNQNGIRGRLWFERMKPDHLPHILKGVKRIAGAK